MAGSSQGPDIGDTQSEMGQRAQREARIQQEARAQQEIIARAQRAASERAQQDATAIAQRDACARAKQDADNGARAFQASPCAQEIATSTRPALTPMQFDGDAIPAAGEEPTPTPGQAEAPASKAAKADPNPPERRASLTPLSVMLALTGAAFTAELVYSGDAVLEVRQRIADRLGKRALQVMLLQNNTSGVRNLEDHEMLVDDQVQVLLRDFPNATLQHNENKPEVYFAISVEDANNNEFVSYIETPLVVQLLERDPAGRGGWALIRYEGNRGTEWPEEIYVRQAHIVDLAEAHVEPHRAPVVTVPDGAVLVKVRNSDGRPDVVFHKDQQAAKQRREPYGFIPSGCLVVSVSARQTGDEEIDWREVQWQGENAWVKRMHICDAQPGESMHDGTVEISHIEGRGDVVYHNTLEAAQAKRKPDGKVPSGSKSTVLEWDTKRGAKGWALLTWRGGEIFVKQAHVKVVQGAALEGDD